MNAQLLDDVAAIRHVVDAAADLLLAHHEPATYVIAVAESLHLQVLQDHDKKRDQRLRQAKSRTLVDKNSSEMPTVAELV